jgi:RING finger protein 113A
LQKYSGDATATSEIDTAKDRDARAILERCATQNGPDAPMSGVYKGLNSYTKFSRAVEPAELGGIAKRSGTQGPIRAPAFIRTTSRFDYQPNICKDYKETGFW